MSRSPQISAFGLRLRVLREAKQLNQKDFGELGGASEASQAAYEKGKTPPSIDYLYKLAEHGVNIGHLLTGTRADADPVDVDFLSEIAQQIKAAYDDAGMAIGHVMLVQSAATIYCDLAEAYDTIDECRSALRLVIKQLQRSFDRTTMTQPEPDFPPQKPEGYPTPIAAAQKQSQKQSRET